MLSARLRARSIDEGEDDLASGAAWLPPECDVAIRRHWFWHADDLDTLKSLQHLEAIWYRSIGLGANLLLNVPPDTRGLIDEHDRKRLVEFGTTMRNRFAGPLPGRIGHDGSRFTVHFGGEVSFDHLWLEEAIEDGQRIGSHRITIRDTGQVIVDGVHTIGSQRVHAFPRITTDTIVIDTDDPDARLSLVHAFETGVEAIPLLEEQLPFPAAKVD